jgi:hypothetical protein
MAEGYLILKIVMWVIELRYRFESQAKVAIQRQFVGRGGPPGPEQACAVNLPERASLGNRRAFYGPPSPGNFQHAYDTLSNAFWMTVEMLSLALLVARLLTWL